jgi:NTP pyrophosphatase (non-canonical NTP hydrolase)
MKETFKAEDFNQVDLYQDLAMKTAIYPNQGENPYYPCLGLAAEIGETCNRVKKMMRDGLTKEELRDTIKGELSDIAWYLSAVAYEFDLELSDIFAFNLNKLYDRKDRGVLGGSGDNR